MTMLDRMRRHKSWLKWSLALVVLTFVVFYIPDFLTPGVGASPTEVIAEVDALRELLLRNLDRDRLRLLDLGRSLGGRQLQPDLDRPGRDERMGGQPLRHGGHLSRQNAALLAASGNAGITFETQGRCENEACPDFGREFACNFRRQACNSSEVIPPPDRQGAPLGAAALRLPRPAARTVEGRSHPGFLPESCPHEHHPPSRRRTVSLLSLGVIGSSAKENEHRLPLHPEHIPHLDADLRARITLEHGYGARFGVDDDVLAEHVAGFASRKDLRDAVRIARKAQPGWARASRSSSR